MRTVFLSVLCLALVYCILAKEKKASASGIKEWFEDLEMDDLPVTANEDKESMRDGGMEIEKRQSSISSLSGATLRFSVKENATVVNNQKTVKFSWHTAYNYNCKPQPVIVKLPTAPHVNALPQYTQLHYCAGSVQIESLQKCVASTVEWVNVEYFDAHTFETRKVTMLNHTACTEVCKESKTACEAQQHRKWVQGACTCKCTLNQSFCTAKGQILDESRCKCVANCHHAKQCHSMYRVFDKDICDCRCSDCLRSICSSHGHKINEKTCSCY